MATKKINSNCQGNNSIDKTCKGGKNIDTQNLNDRISAELWMQHFANVLLRQEAIDEKTYRKLLVKINKEVNRRFAKGKN